MHYPKEISTIKMGNAKPFENFVDRNIGIGHIVDYDVYWDICDVYNLLQEFEFDIYYLELKSLKNLL